MADGEVTTLASLGLEAFQIVEVHRSELKSAPYNPRTLGDAERRKLKAGLKRHGLVAPITWNRRTGNLVGGHQRIRNLDDLAGTADYRLTVAAIDVDEAREKELNVLLNNQAAMGDWNLEELEGLVRDGACDIAGMGFDHADIFRLFGDSPLMERESSEKLEELADKVRAARDLYDSIRSGNKAKDSEAFYLVVIGKNAEAVTAFLARNGLVDNRYQSLEDFERLLDQRSGGSSPTSG